MLTKIKFVISYAHRLDWLADNSLNNKGLNFMTDSQKQRGRPTDPNSSLSKARTVYASLPAGGNDRKSAIAAFQNITVSDGSKLSAGTSAAYFSVITRPKAAKVAKVATAVTV